MQLQEIPCTDLLSYFLQLHRKATDNMLTFNTSSKELNIKCSCKRWAGFLWAHDGDGDVPLALNQSVPCAVWHFLLDKNED